MTMVVIIFNVNLVHSVNSLELQKNSQIHMHLNRMVYWDERIIPSLKTHAAC
jgi:hypothetical protein